MRGLVWCSIMCSKTSLLTRLLMKSKAIIPGADPGFWERGGLNTFTIGGGYVTARGSGGALIAPPVGSAFLLLRLFYFSMKFTVKSNTYTSCVIRITRACMDSDEKTVHSSQCYDSYCSVIKFVTQSYCEFGVHVTMHAPATCRSKNDTCSFTIILVLLVYLAL